MQTNTIIPKTPIELITTNGDRLVGVTKIETTILTKGCVTIFYIGERKIVQTGSKYTLISGLLY